MLTKYAFIDVDGVLNSHRTILVNNGNSGCVGDPDVSKVLDLIAIRLIDDLRIKYGVELVLCSSWGSFIEHRDQSEQFILN